MAFVCTINLEAHHVEAFQNGGEYTVVSRIGVDYDRCLNYFLTVALSPLPGYDNTLEYTFFVVEVNGYTGEERFFHSGLDVSEIFTPRDKAVILATVLWATEKLLNAVRPTTVYRCTHDMDAPEKALEKHYLIGKAFEKAGYELKTCDPYHGKRSWFAYRATQISQS